MRWFKHFSNARSNPKILWLKKRLGEVAYGRVFMLYEIVSELGGSGDSFDPRQKINGGPVNFDYFAEVYGIPVLEVKKTLKLFAEIGIIDKQAWEEQMLYIPQLIEYRDETADRFRSKAVRELVGDHTRHRLEESRVDKSRLEKSQFPETKIASIAIEIYGSVEDKKLFKKEIRALAKERGEKELLSEFESWLKTHSFSGDKPVCGFIRYMRAPGKKVLSLKPIDLAEVEKAVAEIVHLTDSKVYFLASQKPTMAKLVAEFGCADVTLGFKKFWEGVDDYTIKFAAKNFIEAGDQIIRQIIREREESEARRELVAQADLELQRKAAIEMEAFLAQEAIEQEEADRMNREMGFEPIKEPSNSTVLEAEVAISGTQS